MEYKEILKAALAIGVLAITALGVWALLQSPTSSSSPIVGKLEADQRSSVNSDTALSFREKLPADSAHYGIDREELPLTFCRGKIVDDEFGAPLHAQISADSLVTWSDATDGTFWLNLGATRPDQIAITCSGYQAQVRSAIELDMGVIELQVADRYDIRVVDRYSATVPHAKLWHLPHSGRYSTPRLLGETDSSGQVQVGLVGAGIVWAEKHHAASSSVDVGAIEVASPLVLVLDQTKVQLGLKSERGSPLRGYELRLKRHGQEPSLLSGCTGANGLLGISIPVGRYGVDTGSSGVVLASTPAEHVMSFMVHGSGLVMLDLLGGTQWIRPMSEEGYLIRVTDKENGAPVDSAVVWWSGYHRHAGQRLFAEVQSQSTLGAGIVRVSRSYVDSIGDHAESRLWVWAPGFSLEEIHLPSLQTSESLRVELARLETKRRLVFLSAENTPYRRFVSVSEELSDLPGLSDVPQAPKHVFAGCLGNAGVLTFDWVGGGLSLSVGSSSAVESVSAETLAAHSQVEIRIEEVGSVAVCDLPKSGWPDLSLATRAGEAMGGGQIVGDELVFDQVPPGDYTISHRDVLGWSGGPFDGFIQALDSTLAVSVQPGCRARVPFLSAWQESYIRGNVVGQGSGDQLFAAPVYKDPKSQRLVWRMPIVRISRAGDFSFSCPTMNFEGVLIAGRSQSGELVPLAIGGPDQTIHVDVIEVTVTDGRALEDQAPFVVDLQLNDTLGIQNVNSSVAVYGIGSVHLTHLPRSMKCALIYLDPKSTVAQRIQFDAGEVAHVRLVVGVGD